MWLISIGKPISVGPSLFHEWCIKTEFCMFMCSFYSSDMQICPRRSERSVWFTTEHQIRQVFWPQINLLVLNRQQHFKVRLTRRECENLRTELMWSPLLIIVRTAATVIWISPSCLIDILETCEDSVSVVESTKKNKTKQTNKKSWTRFLKSC